jgi:ferredoxin
MKSNVFVFLQAMALQITDDCIVCARCERECPTESIFLGVNIYQINPDTCVECVGFFKEPMCVAVCPKECITKLEVNGIN